MALCGVLLVGTLKGWFDPIYNSIGGGVEAVSQEISEVELPVKITIERK